MKTSEYKEQCAYFEWVAIKRNLDSRYAMIGSTQNGAQLAHGPRQYLNLLKAGFPKGFPDIFCLVPSAPFHGLFLELKIKPNGPTPEQLDWIDRLNLWGYQALIAWSCDELISITEAYLNFTLCSGESARDILPSASDEEYRLKVLQFPKKGRL